MKGIHNSSQLTDQFVGIPAGTSGTWVSTEMIEPARSIWPQNATARTTDDEANEKVTVFGQVVADDALGDAYVVPLCDILDDVKHVLDAQEARLPASTSEINTILRMLNNTTIASLGTTANDLTPTGLLENKAEPKPEAPNNTYCTQCGSEDHINEICGIADIHNSEGSAPAIPPAVTASYTPSTYAVSTKNSKEMVWFCSNCGDGPIRDWQTFCAICGHEQCSSCRVEDTN